MTTEVVLGLGTNLGDRLGHLRRTVRALRAAGPALEVLAISPIYESDAMVLEGAPDDWRRPYLNLAMLARFDGTLEGLLDLAKTTELALGRRPAPRWAPREADIDILFFGGERTSAHRVAAPHPGLAERPFALLPLADLTPAWRFPEGTAEAGRTAREVALRWAGDHRCVPFKTRRTGLCLTELVGIVNLTPDSFSDGGMFAGPDAAAEHALGLAAAGAGVLDLGGESTRPGSRPIGREDEWNRLGPVLERVISVRPPGIRVSVDTRHPEIAARALAAGADWINDVTGFTDLAMLDLVARSSADLLVMHSLTIPPSREATLPLESDPIAEIDRWSEERMDRLRAAGIRPDRVILDPGVGFGKTPDQSLALVRRARELERRGARWLVGHSRKSFLSGWFAAGEPGATDASARDPETAQLSAILAGQQVDYIRVHDVAGSARALRAWALAGPMVRLGRSGSASHQ